MARKLIYLKLIGILIFLHSQCTAVFLLDPNVSALEQLYSGLLIKEGKPLKLHLGCGVLHFHGYINIDFPPSEHTIRTTSGADVFGDIRTLEFPGGSVDEITSHHVFEHFVRPEAMALLCQWYTWLKIDGTLIIETPDFEKCITMVINKNYSYDEKQTLIRHIFGSHEASWAIHCDGWYREKYEKILTFLGFENIQISYNTGTKLLPNIIVRARKRKNISSTDLEERAKQMLRKSIVSEKEKRLWTVWCKTFDTLFTEKY